MLQNDALFYWKGQQTGIFTERFQEICPLEHVMTCSSGTAALHIAVGAMGLVPGDEVITSPITDIGTVIGVIYQQGVPVFADLGASTLNLDPASVEACITPRTKAIIAVHLAGNPCKMQELRAIADKHGLVLIEDSCQAWGAKYRGAPIGTLGDISCWSLQNSKHITTGDGGVVASAIRCLTSSIRGQGLQPGRGRVAELLDELPHERAAAACWRGRDAAEGIPSRAAGQRSTRRSRILGFCRTRCRRIGVLFNMFRIDRRFRVDRAHIYKARR